MFEKVNPCHPDKVADRIAGAIVDLAYSRVENPKIAVEVLIGHGECNMIIESDISMENDMCFEDVCQIVRRIVGKKIRLNLNNCSQDSHLAENQKGKMRCGDNGIFKGVPTTEEQKKLSAIAHGIYENYPSDGKYVIDEETEKLIICQSNAETSILKQEWPDAIVNPLGDWTGGINVDTGATNRKLGSDMGDAVTGGGLHGKDLSKADVSVNIYAHLKAQETGEIVTLNCAIGDETIDGKPYSEIVEIARKYIATLGGFEKLAEWGLI